MNGSFRLVLEGRQQGFLGQAAQLGLKMLRCEPEYAAAFAVLDGNYA
jgi:hypothetical protein